MPLVQSRELPFKKLIQEVDENNGGDWLRELNKRALQRYENVGWPGAKTESWKYTNLNNLASAPFSLATDYAASVPEDMVLPIDCPRLVIINGMLNEDLSDIDALAGGVSMNRLADIKEHQKSLFDDVIEESGSTDGLPLANLNTAMFSDAVFLEITEGSIIKAPLHIISVGFGADVSFAPRVFISVGKGSEINILESHVGCLGSSYFSNSVTQLNLQSNSRVGHYRLQNETNKSYHIGLTKAVISDNAIYDNFTLNLGGLLSRNEIRTLLAGSNIDCCLNGAYLGLGNQHIDNTTFIEHLAEGSRSREVYKGVLAGKARGVFQGKILVHAEAQKTDGYQMNRAMLLSDQAEIDSKPELEIYADDVRCSHGATVGELEEDHIFYLCARGIDRESARRMLVGAYVNEVIEEVKDVDVRCAIQSVAEKWLKLNLYEATK